MNSDKSASGSCVPELIEMLEPNHMLVVWADDHESIYSHRQLRLACTCASCVDEWTREPILKEEQVGAEVRVNKTEPTGNYGMQLSFSDGHSTGIYTFEALRALDNAANASAGGD